MKDTTVRIRITTLEKDLVRKEARKYNMSLSEYIRFITLNGEVKMNYAFDTAGEISKSSIYAVDDELSKYNDFLFTILHQNQEEYEPVDTEYLAKYLEDMKKKSDEEILEYLMTCDKAPFTDCLMRTAKYQYEKGKGINRKLGNHFTRIFRSTNSVNMATRMLTTELSRTLGAISKSFVMEMCGKNNWDFVDTEKDYKRIKEMGEKPAIVFMVQSSKNKINDSKTPDFYVYIRSNNDEWIGEEKIINDDGGSQNNAYRDALSYLDENNYPRGFCIIDGIPQIYKITNKRVRKGSYQEIINTNPRCISLLNFADFINGIIENGK